MATVAVEQAYMPASYDHTAYDGLPMLDDAVRQLDTGNAAEHIKSSIREVFLRHNANDTFVLQLLHRHFDMSPNEKLVEYGPVQNPWPVAADQEAVEGGHVLPKSWRVYNDELHPFEFQFVPATEQRKNPVFTMGFVDDLRAVLKTTGLDDVVGISLADQGADSKPDDLVEITIGRNSMMVPTGKAPAEGVDATVPAAWSFSGTADDTDVARWCRHGGLAHDSDNAQVARWCRHGGLADESDKPHVARWCRHGGLAEGSDDTQVARWCRHGGLAEGSDDTQVARWCRHGGLAEGSDKPQVARWCRHGGLADDSDKPQVARWCRHGGLADDSDKPQVARWCRHGGLADDSDKPQVARWCRHGGLADDSDKPQVARWCRHGGLADSDDAKVARWCRHGGLTEDSDKAQVARWCRHGGLADSDNAEVARWCRHGGLAEDVVEAASL